MPVLPPPNPFPRHATFFRLPAGASLHRLHDRAYGPDEFNPGKGQPSRFAPIRDAAGRTIPTLYAGTSYECAAFEYVFHDVVHDQPVKTVPLSRIAPLCHSALRPLRDLLLVQLFEADLNAWGATRADVIATLPAAYPQTARWAEAIHTAQPRAHGLVWTSRRCDPDLCVVLFGDRVTPGTLQVRSTVPLAASDGELGQIEGFAARAGIAITL